MSIRTIFLFLSLGMKMAASLHRGPDATPWTCPTDFTVHQPGYWQNSIPGPPTNPSTFDTQNGTVALCSAKCRNYHLTVPNASCDAFELVQPTTANASTECYIYPHPLQSPFEPFEVPGGNVITCVAPAAPTPSPGYPTTGHTFPRVSNCWGDDPYISDELWTYHGFPSMTNDTWADYDVLYLNPFDSCCWKQQMQDWVPRIQAIKQKNPQAVVLATFHATEVWAEDLVTTGGV